MKNSKNDDMFFLKRFIVGPMEANCYLIADADTKSACLVDPGADPGEIKKILQKNGFDLKFIINTHGHGDHIGANRYFNVPVYVHRVEEDFLTDPEKNLSKQFLLNIKSPKADRLLKDGDRISMGRLQLEVIHTPGHTPGSIAIKLDGVVFTGDTLFQGSVGRTDFVYGDEEALLKSIRQRLLVLDDDTIIYPGHGEPSTIGEEKRSNPFLNGA